MASSFVAPAMAQAPAPAPGQAPAPGETPAPAGAQPAAQPQPAQPAAPPLNFEGEVVLWGFSINPDKTADYDKVLEKLKSALQMSTRPEAKEQLAGWRVIKLQTPNQDGSIPYVHVINVVKGADYSINNLVYEAYTDYPTRAEFYEMYKGAVKTALFVMQGSVVADLSK
jgi:hypothetical protein